jgi:hypothetical protein
MRIVLTFRRKDSDRVETLILKPEEYYDPIEPGESYERDAVEKFWKPCEYVDAVESELQYINVDIHNDDERLIRTLRTDYHSNGDASVVYHNSRNEDGSLRWEELIAATEFGPRLSHTLRLYRTEKSRRWTMTMNSLMALDDDGNETFTDFHNPAKGLYFE